MTRSLIFVIFFLFTASSALAENSLIYSNECYAYQGDGLTVTAHISQLEKDYEGLDINFELSSNTGAFEVVSDAVNSSVSQTGNNAYKIHFDLKDQIKTTPNGKEVDCVFKILPMDKSFMYELKSSAVLLGPNKEAEKIVLGQSGLRFYNLNPKFKGSFEKALTEARSEVWAVISKGWKNPVPAKERFPLKEFNLLSTSLMASENEQLVLKLGSYTGMGGSKFGVFVFDFDQSGYKKIFEKLGNDLSTQAVTWDGNTGLLVGDVEWSGSDSRAQLLLYQGGQFVPVFDYVYANCVAHFGCTYKTVFDSRPDSLNLYELTSHVDVNEQIDCYGVKKRALIWDKEKFKFELGGETAVSAEDLESLHKAYPLLVGDEQVKLCADANQN